MKTAEITRPEKTVGRTGKSEPQSAALDTLDAIACGVQARLDEETRFSRCVTDDTVNTARALGIPGPIIEKWAAQRLYIMEKETARLREIKVLLEKWCRERPDIADGSGV